MKRKTRVKQNVIAKCKNGLISIPYDNYHKEELADLILSAINCKTAKLYLMFNDGTKLRIKSHYTNPLDIFKKLKYRRFGG